MIDKGHCKLLHEGDAIAEFADFYDYSSSYPDEENNDNEERKARLDEEIDLNMLDDSGYELVLPSGAKIGHRSLLRYYRYVFVALRTFGSGKIENRILLQNLYFFTILHFRQNLVNDRALVLHKNNNKIQHHYQSFGWVGLSKPEAKK